MLDILHPATYKVRAAVGPASPQRIVAPTSPASSTSTLKASSRSKADSFRRTASQASGISTARSRGQQARRYSIESAVSSSTKYSYAPRNHSHAFTDRNHSTKSERALARRNRRSASATNAELTKAGTGHQSRNAQRPAHTPLLGGLYFSDLVVVAFFYAINLLRTCGLAELFDVAFKAVAYVFTRLPFEFYHRWSLSRNPSEFSHPIVPSQRTINAPLNNTPAPLRLKIEPQLSSSAITTSDDEASEQDDADAQLSPFHHLVILLVKFACTSFPHLVPRVLFAEETIGPLVRWRTGGGAAGIVREFTGPDAPKGYVEDPQAYDLPKPQQQNTSKPNFRAFWIGADAHIPVEVRRSHDSAKGATTLLYLHGGGFSLGSVAFYAEALIRIITKVCRLEGKDNDARCVAVEYDLSPSSRFPGPLLQCLRCYAHLIEVEGITPSAITIAGDSAGGNLAMAMLLCLDGQAKGDPALAERDWSSLPMPGRTVLISPWSDLRPSASIAFAPLRNPESHQHERVSSVSGDNTTKRVSVWTEAIAQYEWDYVAAEALMHFAQLYSGVIKTPRRVRGPMGWVANFCAIIAGDGADLAQESSKTAPLKFLRLLTSPPRRLVRAAHSMLTEPLLDRTSELLSRASDKNTSGEVSLNVSPSTSAMGPIFPKHERKTDTVPTSAELFIPVWDQDKLTQRQKDDAQFCAAVDQLETNKLINPAIGDWSRIRLEHGMLVVWGDRERLADDIEAWVERVRAAQTAAKRDNESSLSMSDPFDDKPGQDEDPWAHSSSVSASKDGQTIQERRAASRSPLRPDECLPAREWVCTAVEHGPAGVHAWPFVSMYLAGSEFEREKGLDILASFIAQPYASPASTSPITPQFAASAPLSVKLPSDKQLRDAVRINSPPHLNTVSPSGSMPSDMGFSDNQDDRDYLFNPPSNDGSEEWDLDARNELGLEGVYPHETVWPNPTPTPSTGMGTPIDDSGSEASFDDEALRVGLGLASDAAAADRVVSERHGRRGQAERNEIEPVRLHHVGRSAQSATMPRQQKSARNALRQPYETSVAGQSSSTGDAGAGRSLADMEAMDTTSSATSPAYPRSPTWTDADSDTESLDPVSAFDVLDSEDPYYHPSPYSAVRYVDDDIAMDPSYYGLSHYTTLRPEGLSDIAEEDSQMDLSSIMSNGGGLSGARSPAFTDEVLSPFESTSPNMTSNRPATGRYAGAYASTALDMARLRQALQERERQYQQRFVGARGGEAEVSLDNASEKRPARARFPLEDGDEAEADAEYGIGPAPIKSATDTSTARSSGSEVPKWQPLPTFASTPDGWSQSQSTSPASSVKDVWW